MEKIKVDTVEFYDTVLRWVTCQKAKSQRLGQWIVNHFEPKDLSQDEALWWSDLFYTETVDDFWSVVFDYVELI